MIAGAWDVIGPPDGPLIVFIHGTRVTRAAWRAVTARLADTYRCVCLDLPGHGALADRPFTLDAAADAVERALDDAGGGRAVLVGLSLGGYVAMAAAGRAPGRVRGLVLAGSSAEPSGPAAAAFRLFAWALGVVPQRPLDALNTWLFRRRYPPEIAEPIVEAGYWSRGGAAAVRTLPETRFRDRLLAYGGPILVINGDLDIVFRLGERSFLRGVPNVTRQVLRWTTHLSPLDRPDAFAAAVRRFAERLPA
jgi:pimeloyl-ACP methyl ester carboxylesterase